MWAAEGLVRSHRFSHSAVTEKQGSRIALTPIWRTLRRLDIHLRCDRLIIETGPASNVLQSGPVVALRHMFEVLSADPSNPLLRPRFVTRVEGLEAMGRPLRSPEECARATTLLGLHAARRQIMKRDLTALLQRTADEIDVPVEQFLLGSLPWMQASA